MKRSGLRILGLAAAAALAAGPAAWPQRAPETRLPEGTRIWLELNDPLSTRQNSEGDKFTAEVAIAVVQSDRVVLPKGAIVTGNVSRVIRPGRFRGRAGLNLTFDSIRVPGHAAVPLAASLVSIQPDKGEIKEEATIQGEGSKGKDTVSVVKPAAGGAGIGGLIGGGKGAAIGGGVGALVGLAGVMATRGKDIDLQRGARLEIVLDRPLVLGVDVETLGIRNR